MIADARSRSESEEVILRTVAHVCLIVQFDLFGIDSTLLSIALAASVNHHQQQVGMRNLVCAIVSICCSTIQKNDQVMIQFIK